MSRQAVARVSLHLLSYRQLMPAVTAAAATAGLPHSLAKTKQALQRRYAVAAMSSLDRRESGGGRCFQW